MDCHREGMSREDMLYKLDVLDHDFYAIVNSNASRRYEPVMILMPGSRWEESDLKGCAWSHMYQLADGQHGIVNIIDSEDEHGNWHWAVTAYHWIDGDLVEDVETAEEVRRALRS